MEGTFLRFYVEENERHDDVLLWEWLLEKACEQRIRGGSAFRAIGGFGRHHMLHESRFFELAGSVVVEVEFIVNDEEAKRLLGIVQSEGVRVFYARIPAFFGVLNPDRDDPSDALA